MGKKIQNVSPNFIKEGSDLATSEFIKADNPVSITEIGALAIISETFDIYSKHLKGVCSRHLVGRLFVQGFKTVTFAFRNYYARVFLLYIYLH